MIDPAPPPPWTCTLRLADEAATTAFGAALADRLRAGDVVALSGPLGAGKSTLARGAIAAFAGIDDAPSPTFGLAHSYPCNNTAGDTASGALTLHHFDLYRLETPEDVWELGLEDALDGGVCVIEWPERIARFLPPETLVIRLAPAAAGADAPREALLRSGVSWEARLGDIVSP